MRKRNLRLGLMVLVLSLGLLMGGGSKTKVQATECGDECDPCADCDLTSVSIDPLKLPCGEQKVIFTGSANYASLEYQFGHLIVWLDGTNIYEPADPEQPNPWSTPPTLVTVGPHTLMAEIHSDRPIGHDWTVTSDSWRFEIEACGAQPSPSPSPISKKYSLNLGKNGPTCDSNQFRVSAEPKIDGVAQSGVLVEFGYKGETKTDTSSSPAEVDFEFRGDDQVTAKANGYPTETIGVESAKDCPAGRGGPGEVLGVTDEPEPIVQGQVLGASTLAETGTFTENLFYLIFALGAGLMGWGIRVYGKKS